MTLTPDALGVPSKISASCCEVIGVAGFSALRMSVVKKRLIPVRRFFAAWPAEALLGRMSWLQFIQGCGIGCLWIAVFSGVVRFIFNRGVRNYSGIGA